MSETIAFSSLVIGLSLMVGLALLFSFLVGEKQGNEIQINFSHFIGFLTIFCAFVVWGGLMYSWVLVFLLIMSGLVLVFEFYSRRGGGVS